MTRWYEIAGLCVRVDGEIMQRELREERYGPFETEAREPDLRIEIESESGYYNRLVAAGTPGEDPYLLRDGLWTIHRIDYEASILGPRHLRGRTDGSVGAANGLLRHLLVWELQARGGLLLHAAGVRVGTGVLALAGPSGAGKTTACRHAPPWATVLGDEHLALRPEADGVWAWGTPIVGELALPGRPEGGPLQALYFIEHAAQDRLTPLDAHETARRLIPCTVFYPRDKDTNAQALDACMSTAKRVRAYRLEAKAKGSFWPLLAPAEETRR